MHDREETARIGAVSFCSENLAKRLAILLKMWYNKM